MPVPPKSLGFSSFLRPSRHFFLLTDDAEPVAIPAIPTAPVEHCLTSATEVFTEASPVVAVTGA